MSSSKSTALNRQRPSHRVKGNVAATPAAAARKRDAEVKLAPRMMTSIAVPSGFAQLSAGTAARVKNDHQEGARE